MTALDEVVRDNLAELRDEIEAACRQSSRDPRDVQLIAVTKYADDAWVEALLDAGVDQFGESRPQQLVERATSPVFARMRGWHLIGHLQRNKVRAVLGSASLIHSVDSLRLAETIDRIAGEEDLRPQVLLQVNVSGEASKQGFSLADVVSEWPVLQQLGGVEICGLMTMAPHTQDVEIVRSVFRQLRALRDQLNAVDATVTPLQHLSMGMSGDFTTAIEEGATMIRIGSRLFEGL